MTAAFRTLLKRPWIWSFVGAGVVWLAAIAFTGGYGAGGMLTAALSLSVFTVIVGVGQMFVITLGPGNVDLSLPANIGRLVWYAPGVTRGEARCVQLGRSFPPYRTTSDIFFIGDHGELIAEMSDVDMIAVEQVHGLSAAQ